MAEGQNQQTEDYEDAAILEEKGFRVEDIVGLTRFHSEPTKLKDSNYHRFLSKEMAIGNIDKKDVPRLLKKVKLINLFTFLKLHEIAKIYHSELIGELEFNRSADGFERKQQTTVTHQIKKEIMGEKKRLFG